MPHSPSHTSSLPPASSPVPHPSSPAAGPSKRRSQDYGSLSIPPGSARPAQKDPRSRMFTPALSQRAVSFAPDPPSTRPRPRPTWLKPAVAYLRSVSDSELWQRLVTSFEVFEQRMGYAATGVSSPCRPCYGFTDPCCRFYLKQAVPTRSAIGFTAAVPTRGRTPAATYLRRRLADSRHASTSGI